jgi:hypothetical protein
MGLLVLWDVLGLLGLLLYYSMNKFLPLYYSILSLAQHTFKYITSLLFVKQKPLKVCYIAFFPKRGKGV